MPPADVPTRILVLRHGESTWNVAGRWQGHADPPLTSHGELQATRAADLLEPVDLVVSSDLQRAHRTAELIAEGIGSGPVRLDQRFREVDAGEWQGLTRDEVEEQWPGYLDEHRRPPSFEPYAQAAERVRQALVGIGAQLQRAQLQHGHALAVSHGGVIFALRRLLGAADARIPNLGGGWFHVVGPVVEAGPSVGLVEPVEQAAVE